MIGLLFTAVFFPLVGLAIARAIGRVSVPLAGLGAVGFILFIAGVWHVPLAIPIGVLLVVSVLAFKRVRDETRYPRVPTVLLFIPFVVLFAATIILPLADYDGRAFWLLKAKAIAAEDAVDGPFFRGHATYSPRNEYPLLVSLDAAAVWKIATDLDDRHVRWIYLLFGLGFALELRRRFAKWFSPETGAWCAAVFAWLPQIAVDPEGSMVSAYNDIALGAFVACAFFELIEGDSPLRFGMWVAFASLTKSEGLPLALLLLAAGAFVFRTRIRTALILPAIAILHLIAWRARIAPSDEPDYARMIFDLPQHLENFGVALGRLLLNIVELRDWGLVLIAAAIAVLFIRDAKSRLAVAIIAAMLLLYAAVLAVATWPLAMIGGNIAPRLATHLLGPAFYVIARLISDSPSSAFGTFSPVRGGEGQ